MQITVRMYGGTYIARCQGKTASCTAGPDHAARAVAYKVLGEPAAVVELTPLPEERYGYTRWEASQEQTAVRQEMDPAPHTAAVRDVLAERARQVQVEGFTPENDDMYHHRQLARAALSYTDHYAGRAWVFSEHGEEAYCDTDANPFPDEWPMDWDDCWWKPKSPRQDLVRAVALIIAEIERLDRADGKSDSVHEEMVEVICRNCQATSIISAYAKVLKRCEACGDASFVIRDIPDASRETDQ